MAGLPPLRYLRKSTALLALLFVAFFLHRLFVGLRPPVVPVTVENGLPVARSVVCRNIVGGTPFGVDSVFIAGRNRVYVVSTWKERLPSLGDTLRHVWYYGGSRVLTEDCPPGLDRCVTSVAPEQLLAGEWSVDLVQGRRLLSSRQFRVLDDGS